MWATAPAVASAVGRRRRRRRRVEVVYRAWVSWGRCLTCAAFQLTLLSPSSQFRLTTPLLGCWWNVDYQRRITHAWEHTVFNLPALSIGAKYSCCGQIDLPANMHLYCFQSHQLISTIIPSACHLFICILCFLCLCHSPCQRYLHLLPLFLVVNMFFFGHQDQTLWFFFFFDRCGLNSRISKSHAFVFTQHISPQVVLLNQQTNHWTTVCLQHHYPPERRRNFTANYLLAAATHLRCMGRGKINGDINLISRLLNHVGVEMYWDRFSSTITTITYCSVTSDLSFLGTHNMEVFFISRHNK